MAVISHQPQDEKVRNITKSTHQRKTDIAAAFINNQVEHVFGLE